MDILSAFSRDKSNLVAILQQFQHQLGYLPEEIIEKVADYLSMSPATVYSIATFIRVLNSFPPVKGYLCLSRDGMPRSRRRACTAGNREKAGN